MFKIDCCWQSHDGAVRVVCLNHAEITLYLPSWKSSDECSPSLDVEIRLHLRQATAEVGSWLLCLQTWHFWSRSCRHVYSKARMPLCMAGSGGVLQVIRTQGWSFRHLCIPSLGHWCFLCQYQSGLEVASCQFWPCDYPIVAELSRWVTQCQMF